MRNAKRALTALLAVLVALSFSVGVFATPRNESGAQPHPMKRLDAAPSTAGHMCLLPPDTDVTSFIRKNSSLWRSQRHLLALPVSGRMLTCRVSRAPRARVLARPFHPIARHLVAHPCHAPPF